MLRLHTYPDQTQHKHWKLVRRLAGLVFVPLGTAPVVLGGLAAGLLEPSVSSVAAGVGTGAIVYWPLLLLAAAFVPALIGRRTPRGWLLRRPATVVLLLLVQVGWVWGTRDPLPEAPRSQAYLANARHDLELLVSQQEIRFDDVGAYSDDWAALGFVSSDSGVILRLEATETGWAATTAHELDPDVSCAVYGGGVERPPSTAAGHVPGHPGEVICEPVMPFGAFGRWLRRYHAYLGDNLLSLL